MALRRCYTVAYKLHKADEPKGHVTMAASKEEAYKQATFYDIPFITGEHPYSTWVEGVTYQNGNYRRFNTFEGKPY